MNIHPDEIIYFILNKLPTFDKIKIFMIVCKRWYFIIKSNHNKITCNNFEDFILNDRIHLYPMYSVQFNQSIYFLPLICDPNDNLYKLINKTYRDNKIDDDNLFEWIVSNNYLKIMIKLCQRINICDFIKPHDYNYGARNNYRVIFVAIENGYNNMVKYILDKIDVRQCNEIYYGVSIECDNIEMVKYFSREKKVNITIFDQDCLKNCSINATRYFFKCGKLKNINFDIMGDRNFSKDFIIQLFPLIKKYDDQYDDIDLEIIQAVINNDLQKIIEIHSEGFDLNKSNNFMILAAKLNHLDIVKYICETCDPSLNLINIIFKSELNPKYLDVIKYLFNIYPTLISENQSDCNILKIAIYHNNFDLVKFLFSVGFSLNEYDASRLFTPDLNILPILKYIYELHPEVLIQSYTIIHIVTLFGEQSDLDYFQIKNFDSTICYKNFLNMAIKYNNHKMIKIFYET